MGKTEQKTLISHVVHACLWKTLWKVWNKKEIVRFLKNIMLSKAKRSEYFQKIP
ncbi:hypothetical protein HMPREF1141_0722 [Clostridium sp. MSTE9]|nr:hypothetical protein HMPREF1141_0722 [Clostridium sp. MSTE9]